MENFQEQIALYFDGQNNPKQKMKINDIDLKIQFQNFVFRNYISLTCHPMTLFLVLLKLEPTQVGENLVVVWVEEDKIQWDIVAPFLCINKRQC